MSTAGQIVRPKCTSATAFRFCCLSQSLYGSLSARLYLEGEDKIANRSGPRLLAGGPKRRRVNNQLQINHCSMLTLNKSKIKFADVARVLSAHSARLSS